MKRFEKKLDRNYARMLRVFLNKSGNSILQNNSCTVICLPCHKSSKQGELDILGIAGKVKINALANFFYALLPMSTPMLTEQQKHAFISSMRTLGVV